jgi:hypothetical protein
MRHGDLVNLQQLHGVQYTVKYLVLLRNVAVSQCVYCIVSRVELDDDVVTIDVFYLLRRRYYNTPLIFLLINVYIHAPDRIILLAYCSLLLRIDLY